MATFLNCPSALVFSFGDVVVDICISGGIGAEVASACDGSAEEGKEIEMVENWGEVEEEAAEAKSERGEAIGTEEVGFVVNWHCVGLGVVGISLSVLCCSVFSVPGPSTVPLAMSFFSCCSLRFWSATFLSNASRAAEQNK